MLKNSKIITIFLSFILSLFLITVAVKATLNFRVLYYYDISHLNIEENISLTKAEINGAYNYLIDYLNETNYSQFKIPALPSSKEAIIHFEDVKNIFIKLNYLFYIGIISSIFALAFIKKTNNYKILKYCSNLLFFFILSLIPFSLNFDKSFTLFHKLFFSNDYWLFNPEYDPIILILPEEFFFHCAILIVSLILLFGLVLRIGYSRLKYLEMIKELRLK